MNPMNNRVKELRLERKLSQEEFGKAIGLSKSGVSNIEKGTRAVRKNHIRLICSEFGVSEAWLCEGLAVETANLEAFIGFLKNASFHVSVQQVSEHECEIALNKGGEYTVFSQNEFIELQNAVKDVIETRFYKKIMENKK